MNTGTCHICHQSVPLDDSGRLESHNILLHPKEWEPCPGSGTTPQAPDGAEKVEDDAELRKAVEDDLQQFFINSLTPDRGYICPPINNTKAYIATLLAQAREKIAGLEKALEEVQERVHRQPNLRAMGRKWVMTDCEMQRERAGRLEIFQLCKSALDAARDKKGTE